MVMLLSLSLVWAAIVWGPNTSLEPFRPLAALLVALPKDRLSVTELLITTRFTCGLNLAINSQIWCGYDGKRKAYTHWCHHGHEGLPLTLHYGAGECLRLVPKLSPSLSQREVHGPECNYPGSQDHNQNCHLKSLNWYLVNQAFSNLIKDTIKKMAIEDTKESMNSN